MANTVFKHNEIIVLLGAGASVEAGIPDSMEMVRQIEDKVSGNDPRWARYRELYRYIRSSVLYADGLEGITGDDVLFNIERLVNVLDELIKKERHTLYPFVGAWNPKLLEVAGKGFEHVREFRNAILDLLRRDWLSLPREETADYYSGLLRFQNEYQFSLRVFSLNYDLCVEKACSFEKVQRGFAERRWDWRLFDETSDDPVPLLLYKLHGSADWYFNKDRIVMYSDSTSSIQDDAPALIFGTSYKLQYLDPFLFLAYELRRWTLDTARAIICIGYGFNDEHINGILEQALRQDSGRRLLAVLGPARDKAWLGSEEGRIKGLLNLNADEKESQVRVRGCGAKEFLREQLTVENLAALFPPDVDLMGSIVDEEG